MSASQPKTELHQYLRTIREALLWKLDGVSEYDVRRPLVPTGTNLLGLVKHLASIELGYFGLTFARPYADPPPWFGDYSDPFVDMWATADESRAGILDLYARAAAHSDTTIESLPLDGTGTVPWWPPERATVTLHRILIHVIAETNRHAGQADIVRELIDGTVGLRPDADNMGPGGREEWAAYHDRLETVAQQFRED